MRDEQTTYGRVKHAKHSGLSKLRETRLKDKGEMSEGHSCRLPTLKVLLKSRGFEKVRNAHNG